MEHQRFFRYGRIPAYSLGMTAFCAGVFVLNVAHPLLHPFEGGTLDAALHHLNMMAMAWLDFDRGMGDAS